MLENLLYSFPERKFKLWFYQVSHSEAIIRSPKTDMDKVYTGNIDIYLGDIDYLEIPQMFRGLQIETASEEDKAYLSRKLEKEIPITRIVELVSEGKRFYAVAGILKILENDLDYGVLPIYAFLANKNVDVQKSYRRLEEE